MMSATRKSQRVCIRFPHRRAFYLSTPLGLSSLAHHLNNHKRLQYCLLPNSQHNRAHPIPPDQSHSNLPHQQQGTRNLDISRSELFPSPPEQNPRQTDTMSTKIPTIFVADTIGKHNEELLRDPKTGLMPWETRLGRLKRWLEDAVRHIARKAVRAIFAVANKAPHIFFAAASQRMQKHR
jgi:hypothetical protein